MRISDSEPKFTIDTLTLLSKDKMRGSLLDELWKAHFIDRKVRLAFESLLGEDDATLIRVICKKPCGDSVVNTLQLVRRPGEPGSWSRTKS